MASKDKQQLSPQTNGIIGKGEKVMEKMFYRARHPKQQFNQAMVDKIASRRKKKNHRAQRARRRIRLSQTPV